VNYLNIKSLFNFIKFSQQINRIFTRINFR
jgi:hypothetical protein